MMNSVSPASPAPMAFVPAAPDDAAAAADGPAAFAKALHRAAQAQDSHADRQQQRKVGDDVEPDSPSAAQRAARGKRLPRTPETRPREGAATPATQPADEKVPEAEAEAKAAQQAKDNTQSAEAALALLDLASLMAGLAQGARGAAETGEAAHDSALDAATSTASRTTAQLHAGKAAAQADAAVAQAQDALLGASQGIDSGTLAVDDALATAAVLQGSGATRQVFDNAVGNPMALAAGAAPPGSSAAAVGGAATVFQSELAAALGTPEFASALGAQISVLIRDGVSQAQLHLNPTDMGPIAVHIRLDGENAQVDFSALQALTRQALEDAVPALASALRESGLTLSGGGVFEHARQPQGERHGSRADSTPLTSIDAADAAPTHGAVARAFRARGVVDLYA